MANYTALANSADGWWHTQINLPAALNKLNLSSNGSWIAPVVAVLDSGLDIQNRTFAASLEVPGPRPGRVHGDTNGCDVTNAFKGELGTGSVYPYTTSGFGQACPTGELGVCQHGTHVAGIIAANVDTNTSPAIGGVAGVPGHADQNYLENKRLGRGLRRVDSRRSQVPFAVSIQRRRDCPGGELVIRQVRPRPVGGINCGAC